MYILESIQEDKLPAWKSHITLTHFFGSWEFHKLNTTLDHWRCFQSPHCWIRLHKCLAASGQECYRDFSSAFLTALPTPLFLCVSFCVPPSPSSIQLPLSSHPLSLFSCDLEELSGSPSLDLYFSLTISCNFYFTYWILFSPNTLVEGGYFWPRLKEGWCPHSTDKNVRSLEVCIHALLDLIACSHIDAAINYTPQDGG